MTQKFILAIHNQHWLMSSLQASISKILLIILSIQLYSCNSKPINVNPAIKINLIGAAIKEDDKVDCNIDLEDSTQKIFVNGRIEYRGSNSSHYPKRSYTVRFKHEKALQWQGLTIKGDWVIYAPYADRSLIRNTLAHYYFRTMGNHSPESIFTDLYINGEYMGLYELRKKINLDNKGLEDSKCIFKIDKKTGKKREISPSLVSPNVDIQVHELAKGILFEDAIKPIRYFENALKDDKSDIKTYANVNALADYFLLSEFANSPDAYRSSCYFHISSNDKVEMGPVWDYDFAFGNSTLYNAQDIKGWRFPQSETTSPYYSAAPKWWSLLYKKPEFKTALCSRWKMHRESIFSDKRIGFVIDSITNSLKPLLGENNNKWPLANKSIQWVTSPKLSYQAEIEYLKNWMMKRAQWIDLELNK